MLDDWLISNWWLTPLLTGVIMTAMTGPLGSFVVWRRMAFFGDTLAHGALLGITLGVLIDVNLTLALIVSSLLLGFLLLPLQTHANLSSETLLSTISHSTLAIGLITLSLADGIRVDLMGYLLGDLLAVSQQDLLWVSLAALGVGTVMIWQWQGLLASTISPELAAIEGHAVSRLNALLIVMLALVVALTMKIVGILLVSALLVIPAAAARAFAQTPKQMVILASLIGATSVIMGIAASYLWDTPTGPSIVATAAAIFVFSLLARPKQR